MTTGVGAALFGNLTAQSIGAALGNYVDKSVGTFLAARAGKTGSTQSGAVPRTLVDKFAEYGFGNDTFNAAAKSYLSAEAIGKFFAEAKVELAKKAAVEKLTQAQKRIEELEARARAALARGDVRVLAKLAREAALIGKEIAVLARELVQGNRPDPTAVANAQANALTLTAAGAPGAASAQAAAETLAADPGPRVDQAFARAFVAAARDLLNRTKSLFSQAELFRDRSGRDRGTEEREDDLLRDARRDIAEADTALVEADAGISALDEGGSGTLSLTGGRFDSTTLGFAGRSTAAGAVTVTQTYVRVETITVAVAVQVVDVGAVVDVSA